LVLEAAVKLLTNPIVLRMALVFLAGAFAFVIGVVVMRRMRRNIDEEIIDSAEPASLDSLPLHTYHAVIQQLKQQKHELQSSQQADRRRARTSENISAAILSHLSSGVMFIDCNGLVRQANTAARQILGFASPVGMGLKEVFREAALETLGPRTTLAEMVQPNLRDKTFSRQLEVHYLTPSGEDRTLQVTITSVQSPSGDTLGAACLINDQTELAGVRQQQVMRGEMSAEMALELRNSLATIADCAKRLSTQPDEHSVQRLASDIASEAAHLNHTIGGFLAEPKAARAAAGI
jgi:nitrogen fixation/metabolism regulation signal transduction histidine kinase